jgi:hypothetical protein
VEILPPNPACLTEAELRTQPPPLPEELWLRGPPWLVSLARYATKGWIGMMAGMVVASVLRIFPPTANILWIASGLQYRSHARRPLIRQRPSLLLVLLILSVTFLVVGPQVRRNVEAAGLAQIGWSEYYLCHVPIQVYLALCLGIRGGRSWLYQTHDGCAVAVR